MNTRELAAATAEFDREMVVETFREPTPGEREKLQRAMRKRGRPRVGNGAGAVSVTVERSLPDRADALARRLGVSRSRLFERGLRRVLAAGGAP